ncbi:hypothetical protein VTN77DRAFT_96 [Rasamsonia byssochlamydoides]|uniref:uncharacterized protein n=1 Tax=Rasamsonia byssochlamydoides TaxID=89139 RepID=UPI0037429A96
MVSTRHHPRDFPPPGMPTSATATSTPNTSKPVMNPPSPAAAASSASRKWVHTPSAAVTIWLVVSIPLVLWDAGYVLLRPHSMPGGKLHSPIWTPYALYGTIDYIYGWPAFNARNGFTAAQTVLNLLETACYVYYLAVVYQYGATMTTTGRASQKKVRKGLSWFLFDEKVVAGRTGALALLIAFSGSVATFSKTVLYWLNEAFSGFDNIGHNDLTTLVLYWIIPNGAWLVFPAYMIYVLGEEILFALESAAPRVGPGRPKAVDK